MRDNDLSGQGAFMLIIDRLAESSAEVETLKRTVGDLRVRIAQMIADREVETTRQRSLIERYEQLQRVANDHNAAQEPLHELYQTGEALRKAVDDYFHVPPSKRRSRKVSVCAALNAYTKAALAAFDHINLIPF